ncbi:UDP-N-acetylmuramoyl-L-alanine--D-glutamate ligase [bacterium]|nr:UDP-N-acetylmuramoyl-L-alanine--D-glutamate ligase [bacterium]
MSLDLTGKRVAVIGMARSGIGAARLVHRLGGRALVSDIKPFEALRSAIEELQSEGVEVEAGGHHRVAAEPFDLVVLSPGVVLSASLHEIWRCKAVPVWSELQLAAEVWDGQWIGVTGSNGKTTTVHLIAAMLKQAGRDAMTAGNIGQAWSDLLPANKDRVFVVEVSSFQLERCHRLKPRVAVLLNLFENHLDRHGDMATYADLKSRLLLHQDTDSVAILNGEDEWIRSFESSLPARKIRFGTSDALDFWTTSLQLMCRCSAQDEVILKREEFPLVGRHNELNALAAAAAARQFGADMPAIRQALRTAQPVEHRIEFVGELSGVAFYNDSKSTNMVATHTALDSFRRDVILLFGGRPKKESFAPLAERFGRPIKVLIAFGEALEKIRMELPSRLPIEFVPNLTSAVSRARELAHEGDTVLLSPGCTSFDEFRNFEERGKVFKSLVQQ